MPTFTGTITAFPISTNQLYQNAAEQLQDPTSGDDFAAGYSLLMRWVRTDTNREWLCTGDGQWTEVTGGTTTFGGLTDVTLTTQTRGDIVKVDSAGTGWENLAVGAADEVLLTDGTDPSWGQVATGGLADNAVTLAKIDQSISPTWTGIHDFSGGTTSLRVPVGTTAQRPGSPANGDMRYDSDLGVFQGYENGDWVDLVGEAVPGNANEMLKSDGAGGLTSISDMTFGASGLSITDDVDIDAGNFSSMALRVGNNDIVELGQTLGTGFRRGSSGEALVLTIVGDATGNALLGAGVVGDSYRRLKIDARGIIEWGPGSSARDVDIRRQDADIVRVFDAWAFNQHGSDVGQVTNSGVVYAKDVDSSAELFARAENGNIKWLTPHSIARTLASGSVSFAVAAPLTVITGDGGGSTLNSITAGYAGLVITLLFVDANTTVTDNDAHTANSIDLAGTATNLTSAADTTLTLISDGTSWYEIARSVN